jgi:cell division initiation protein
MGGIDMITPLDIENKKFSKQMVNGYSVEEVDEFLDDLTVQYEQKCKDISEKDRQIAQLEKDLLHYKTIESTLQNTLVIAQSAAEEVKNNAKQQADQIIKDAEGNAKQSVESLNQSIVMKKKELDELEKQFDIYKAKMESLLISQLELIKDMKKEN